MNKISAEVESLPSSMWKYERYLIISPKGNEQLYVYIPDDFPRDILQEIAKRINTERRAK